MWRHVARAVPRGAAGHERSAARRGACRDGIGRGVAVMWRGWRRSGGEGGGGDGAAVGTRRFLGE